MIHIGKVQPNRSLANTHTVREDRNQSRTKSRSEGAQVLLVTSQSPQKHLIVGRRIQTVAMLQIQWVTLSKIKGFLGNFSRWPLPQRRSSSHTSHKSVSG